VIRLVEPAITARMTEATWLANSCILYILIGTPGSFARSKMPKESCLLLERVPLWLSFWSVAHTEGASQIERGGPMAEVMLGHGDPQWLRERTPQGPSIRWEP
jgi:hypothetical protein